MAHSPQDRLVALRDLAARAASVSTPEPALRLAAQALPALAPDVPFALFYEIDAGRPRARLVATTGAPPAPLAMPTVDLDVPGVSPWPLAEVVRTSRALEVETPRTALVLPFTSPGGPRPAAILIAAVKAVPLDGPTRAVYDLLAVVVAGALAGVGGPELARERADALAQIDRATTALEVEIVERTFAEEALRESQQRLATTLHSIGEAVITTDLQERIVSMNPVAERLTGWLEPESVGRPLTEVFCAVDEETRRPAASLAAPILSGAGDPAGPRQLILMARDGAERPIAAHGVLIRTDDGERRGAVLVFRDQSEERRVEAMRVNSVWLEAENLRIQEASRFKSEFLANMSHELRTPLNGIIGFTELMHDGKAGPVSADHLEYLGDILVSARHLLRLISDVLDLAKVESGTMEFRPETVNVALLAGEVRDVLRGMAVRKRIRLDLVAGPDAGVAWLDPGKLKQVLYNYVSNGVKFTSEGGRVTLRVMAEGADFVRFEVEDTGMGIGPDDLKRLFVEFQQLDSGIAKRQPGTGLGLALTKRIVEAQGGRIGVHSALGKGSVFFALLPRSAGGPPWT